MYDDERQNGTAAADEAWLAEQARLDAEALANSRSEGLFTPEEDEPAGQLEPIEEDEL